MLSTTHLSLIAGLRAETPAAWDRFARTYRPWLLDWSAQRLGFHPDDAEEIAQQVMLAVMEEFRKQRRGERPPFAHQGDGSFRAWLRGVTYNRALGFLRSERLRRPVGNGEKLLAALANPDSELSSVWNQEHEATAIQHAWLAIQHEFAAEKWRPVGEVLFRRRLTGQVAGEFGISLRTLFSYQKAIKERLRDLLAGLLEADRG